jgi:hypothetical protein
MTARIRAPLVKEATWELIDHDSRLYRVDVPELRNG